MAEIKIQEKKRPIWPWIVAIIIIGLLVWLLLPQFNRNMVDDNNDDRDTVANADTSRVMKENGTRNEINDFTSFVQQNDTAKTIEAGYVRKGLNHLNDAIKAIISDRNITDSNIIAQSDSLNKFASDIEEDEAKQSGNVRAAFVSAANTLQKIQKNEEPDLNTQSNDLLKDARAINGRETLAEQSGRVKQFFNNASRLLQSIVNKEV